MKDSERNIAHDSTRFTSSIAARDQSGGEVEAELWARFARASTREAFCASWLAIQCRVISGVSVGVVLWKTADGESFFPLAVWPSAQVNLSSLTEAAQRAATERRGLVLKHNVNGHNGDAELSGYDVAYPVEVERRMHGVVVLNVTPRAESQLQAVLRQLQWGFAWLEVMVRGEEAHRGSAPTERLQAVVDIVATTVGQERFHGAAVAFVTALATKLACDRVSLGFLKKGAIEIVALSHSAQFGEDTNLLRAIAASMEETLDQESSVVFPMVAAQRQIQVTRAHGDLARQYGNGALCSVPISDPSGFSGVVTLERPADRPFDDATVKFCEAIVGAAGPILQMQQRDDRPLWRKLADASRTQLEHLIGPGHSVLKLSVLGIVCLVLVMTFVNGDYRVTAKTIIEPATRRALSAPINGYIAEARLRAGDPVRKGQLLAKLDDRELQLERSRWRSQEEQSQKQYYEALGTRNAPQAQVLAAQIDQARAQVALIDDQLSRMQVTAPFDGVIVAGDWSQSLGAPIERGQVLFEVAPLDAYRIILQVDERNIADVDVGRRGRIVLSGFPTEPLPISVVKITPVSTASEGRNYFRVEAQLEGKTRSLQPGMEGVGKIEIDSRKLIWIWTHEVVDWLRLKLWYWLP